MTDTVVQVGLIQMSCTQDPEHNMRKAVDGIREAAERGAQIICLQELFKSIYFCQKEDHDQFALAESVPGPTTELLCDLARKLELVLIAPVFERRSAGLYHNTAAVIDADGALLGRYRKMHIPDDPRYQEKFYFTPGDLGFQTWNTRYGHIGVLICWDQWYPEAARVDGTWWRANPVLPYRHRLASRRKGRIRSESALSLGDYSAEPRDCKRRLRCNGQPGWLRRKKRRMASSSGALALSAIPPATSSRSHLATRRRFWSFLADWKMWKQPEPIGHSFGTGDRKPTETSLEGSWIEPFSTRSRISNASRMGAP